MTIEKRGVMYWINFALLTLFALALIGVVVLLFWSKFSTDVFNDGELYYSSIMDLTYGIIMTIASVLMIVGLVFYVLKKFRVFAYLMTAFFIAITAMAIHGFDRLHLYIFSEYSLLFQITIFLLAVMVIISILTSLVLNGAFGKLLTKIISLVSIIISLVSIVMLIVNIFNPNGRYPGIAFVLENENPWSLIALALFGAPIFAISLWVLVSTLTNKFTNFEKKVTDEKEVVAESVSTEINGTEKNNYSNGQEQPTETEQQPVNNTRFCANCGAQLQEGVAFCPNCGAPCEIQSQPQQPQIDMTAYKEKKEKNRKRIIAFVPVLASFVIAIIALFIAFRPPQPTGLGVYDGSISLNPLSDEQSHYEVEGVYESEYQDLDGVFEVWYGPIKYKSDNESVATVENNGTVVAGDEGDCNITVYSKANVEDYVDVTVENDLEDLYDEAECDPDWATISDDGKTVTFDMLEDSSEAVPAAEYFRSHLHFSEDYDEFWGEIIPNSIYYDDSGSFESDVATCTWEYTTYYYLSNTLEVKFTLN